jgi:hypothetical protein
MTAIVLKCTTTRNGPGISYVVHTISSQEMKWSALSSLQTHLIRKDDILVAGPRERNLVQSRLADIRVVFDPRRGGNWAAWPIS